MDFFLGLLTAVVLFALLGAAYYMGQRHSKPIPQTKPPDEVEKRRREQFEKGFKAIMNYDVATALKRKEVK